MQRSSYVKKRIVSAISLALGTATAMPLYAQIEPTDDERPGMVIEEVVVTGIRSSLKRAMDVKRDSYGVVDAISAEDIGKFPDTNLAESLQRITGVSISRERGEGSEVTVRGFGASFNLVTLNGRQMPTHGGTGRSFNFEDIASESVSGVEVFKTGRASVPTGGIGATINVKTLRPLDKPGLTASFGAKAINDSSNINGDNYTPEYSGIYSQTFLDDTVGITISGVYQKRDSGQAGSSNSAWFDRDGGDATFDNGQHINPPVAGDLVALPQQIIYTTEEWERERYNGQVTLQWRPIDTVTMTADYFYAQLELDHTFNNMSIWFSPTGQSGTWTDGPIVSPLIYTETDNQVDMPMGAGVDATKNERDSAGFNLVWDPTESLSFSLDYHNSTAKKDPNSKYGSNAVITVASFERQGASVDYRKDIPSTTVSVNDPLSPDDMQITGSIFENEWAKMDIEQTQFRADWHFNEQTTVSLGGSYTDLDNFESSSIVQRNSWGQNQASAYGSIADLVVPASLKGIYDELSGGGQVNNNFFLFDMPTMAARGELLQRLPEGDSWHLPTALAGGDCGTGFCADSNKGAGNKLSEETTAVFAEVAYSGHMFDKPFNIRTGIRYEETDVVSSAETQDYTLIEWASPNEFSAIPAEDLIGSGLDDDYNETLPSLDFDIELIDDVVFRASYSETIARSSFEDLRGNLTIGTVLRVVEGLHTADGTVGNPGLQPHKSENIDLSVEWYYGESSYVSVGYFDKSVENFVTSAEFEDVTLFPDLAHPALGPLYADAVNALGITASNVDLRGYIFTNFPNSPGVDVDSGVITGVLGRDGAAFFDFDTKINSNDDANIDGWEIALQHNFGETGFGFIANATIADGDAEFDDKSDAAQFALPGLSDTRNFIGYYDKSGIQVRLAYNWRDKYFTGGTTQPSYTDEYEQWDVTASYEVMDGLLVFVEGLNVTNETTKTYARSDHQVNSVAQSGERYNVGFRYTF
jgi:TonB-dependent receptor